MLKPGIIISEIAVLAVVITGVDVSSIMAVELKEDDVSTEVVPKVQVSIAVVHTRIYIYIYLQKL